MELPQVLTIVTTTSVTIVTNHHNNHYFSYHSLVTTTSGSNVNHADCNGNTVLHYLAANNRAKIGTHTHTYIHTRTQYTRAHTNALYTSQRGFYCCN